MSTETDGPPGRDVAAGLVDNLAEFLVVASSFGNAGLFLSGLVAAVLRWVGSATPLIPFSRWTVGFTGLGVLAWLARGLRRRRNLARIAVGVYLGALAAVNVLWMATAWSLEVPLLRKLPFPERNHGLIEILVTAVLASVAALLLGPTCRAHFRRHAALRERAPQRS